MPDFPNFAFPPLPVQQHGDKLMPRLPTRSIRDTLKPAKKINSRSDISSRLLSLASEYRGKCASELSSDSITN